MPLDAVVLAVSLSLHAASYASLDVHEIDEEINFLIQDSTDRLYKVYRDVGEYSPYMQNDEMEKFNARLIAVDSKLEEFKSEFLGLSYVGKLINRASLVDQARDIMHTLVVESSTFEKLKNAKEKGLKLVIQRDPSVPEQDHVESTASTTSEKQDLQSVVETKA